MPRPIQPAIKHRDVPSPHQDEERGPTRRLSARGSVVACVECRKRKTKCDAGKPSCSQCDRDSINCSYRAWNKTGLRRGYVRSLETRIGMDQQHNIYNVLRLIIYRRP